MREWTRLTRRQLLSGTSRLAFLAVAGPLVACKGPVEQEPWSDGTFFSDGIGWID